MTSKTSSRSDKNEYSMLDENTCSQIIAGSTLLENPRDLVSGICKDLYHLGWATGSSGGMSIREKSRIYCSPSRIQKERINSEDIFVMNEDGDVIEGAKNTKLRYSECLTLFLIPFKIRNAGCCIHSHSIDAILISALYYKKCSKNHDKGDTISVHECRGEFHIANQEMIKGIKRGSNDDFHSSNDTLVIPIIDNALHESGLAENFHKILNEYPLTNAVLVRNHGIFIWGKTWQEAKLMAECYHYLFKLKLDALKYGLNWLLE